MTADFLSTVLNEECLEYIFKEIVNDKGHHGDFLKAFSLAFLRADYSNRILLGPAAVALIAKYDLITHLPDCGAAIQLHHKNLIAQDK